MHRMKVQPALMSMAELKRAAECLRALAHPHRLRILQMLMANRYTVGELAESCKIPSHMASEHLRFMERCSFLKSEKDGRFTYYSVAEPGLAKIMECMKARFGGKK